MPRPPRFSYAHAVHHVTLRCNNREFLFAPPSFELFLRTLREARAEFPLRLYHYCLMTNHVHLLFKVGCAETLSKSMHWLGTSFTRRFNKATGRHGHVWEGRFRSTLIEEASYFLRCMAYVDLNPVRAGMVGDSGDYPWSGHSALRAGDATVLDLSPLYLALGADAGARYRAYRAHLAAEAARAPVSLATEYFVGRAGFVSRMAAKFGFRGRRAFLRRTKLGNGVVSLGPRLGGEQDAK